MQIKDKIAIITEPLAASVLRSPGFFPERENCHPRGTLGG